MNYLTTIKYAVLFFPIIALLFTMPFLFHQYHKYGAISLFKSILIYLFIFYLICAYFLVILPLPKISEVAQMTTPRTQLIPFSFIIDFVQHTSLRITNIHTYILALKESYVYVPLFNIFLTIPFGIFLRYYFQCNMKKTILYTFLLSLFFELTQLSGLYFIYPRGYRLFDVDDLLLNTCGGCIGYMVYQPFLHLIPPIDTINLKTKEKGKHISGLRRTLALLLDLFILMLIECLVALFINNIYLSLIIALGYIFILPLFLESSTPAQKFLNIQVLDNNNTQNIKRLLLRKLLSISFYILLPSFISYCLLYTSDDYIREFVGVLILGFFIIVYICSLIKYLFTSKKMFYEKISQTQLVSTIH